MRAVFAPDVAVDLAEALRLLAGLRQRRGQRLCAGAAELLVSLERGGARSRAATLDTGAADTEGEAMQPALLTYPDAANYVCLPISTLRSLVRSGEVPVVKFGRSVRFHRADLDQLIEAHRSEAAA